MAQRRGFDFASSFCGCPTDRDPCGLGCVRVGKVTFLFVALCASTLLNRCPHRTFFQPSIVPQSVSTAHSELYRFVFCCLQNRSNKCANLPNTSTIVILDK